MTISPSTRASLLLRLRDPQDHAAWMEFVGLYEPVVLRLLKRRGLQEADAFEVLQELFLAFSRCIERWEPAKERGSFRGWLGRVARNLTVNLLRRPERRAAGAGGTDWQAALEEWPDDRAETIEFDRELRAELFHRAAELVQREVQPVTWQAFWETAVAGLSPAEAAEKLGMQPGAVRVAKCRVLARLRALTTAWESQP